MPLIDILNKKDIKKVIGLLERQFGFSGKLDYVFLMNKQNKVYIVKRYVFDLPLDRLKVDKLGMYIGELYKDEMRLSIEGSQLVGPSAMKNIIEIDREQVRLWMAGEPIPGEFSGKGYVLLKDRQKGDFLGCGRISQHGIQNFYPKTRRIVVV